MQQLLLPMAAFSKAKYEIPSALVGSSPPPLSSKPQGKDQKNLSFLQHILYIVLTTAACLDSHPPLDVKKKHLSHWLDAVREDVCLAAWRTGHHWGISAHSGHLDHLQQELSSACCCC